ncbi:MAG TPA: molybdopterin converting factor subunit 1 [Burkholderiaceae bacterium]|jgi:molybdopterin synthase sulfur carrier subunit|nr:molybdopterin converting factor subunit 1 [Burkholderiaceae bacterium]
MNIQLRFFASIRETLGLGKETVSLPDYIDSVGAVRHFLIERGGVWRTALNEQRPLRMAYNLEMAESQTPIADGGEIAFFPPVTGG